MICVSNTAIGTRVVPKYASLLQLLTCQMYFLLFTVSRGAIKPVQAICLVFTMTQVLPRAPFLLKSNFWVCELWILSCNINHSPASRCYKYKTMSSPHSLSHSRKTALLALFIEGLTQAQCSIPHLSAKGQSYSVLQAELLKTYKNSQPYHRVGCNTVWSQLRKGKWSFTPWETTSN